MRTHSHTGQKHGCGVESTPGYLWGRTSWTGHFRDGKQAHADSACAEVVAEAAQVRCFRVGLAVLC